MECILDYLWAFSKVWLWHVKVGVRIWHFLWGEGTTVRLVCMDSNHIDDAIEEDLGSK